MAATERIQDLFDAAPDLRRAARLHDWGKGALFFQTKMSGTAPPRWHRHELFSMLYAISLDGDDVLSELELAAILTHHKNLTDDLLRWGEEAAYSDWCTLIKEQLAPHLTDLQALFGPLPPLRPKAALRFIKRLNEKAQAISVWTTEGRTVAFHRAALVAAAHLASARRFGVTI